MSDERRDLCFKALISDVPVLANICENLGCSNSSGRAKTFEALI